MVHVSYLRNEHVGTAARLGVTETETTNAFTRPASFSVERVLGTYASWR